MASMVKREESPETFLRTFLRTSTLPPANFSDDVSVSSAASTYKEEDVEPPVWLPNTMFAQQHIVSRASSINSSGAYQGSSPRKYRMDGSFSRYVFTITSVFSYLSSCLEFLPGNRTWRKI
jgi:hypothetical protein